MREILGKAKTVRELLKGVKYSIDYYQREYKWHEKQIRELVDDLRGSWGSDMTIDLLDPVALLEAIASVH
jgi:DNA-directed RNA polymerase subunit F